ncbi:hypothetical protein Gogos_011687, partial [Gossypium gossypioides]|nr:hypothetical protein [Gossypium gossypioides]
KGKDTSLRWNLIKGTVDASKDWWENRLKVVPEAQKFRVASIDLELEGKLDQMFLGIVAIGDKAWVPSSGILLSDLFKDEDIETLDKNEGNPIDDVHISTQHEAIDGRTVIFNGKGRRRRLMAVANDGSQQWHFSGGSK